MTTTMNNLPTLPGRQRRSLNDTIGRLDEMIDGLSEAIPGTIRDTLQETVGTAVAELIIDQLKATGIARFPAPQPFTATAPDPNNLPAPCAPGHNWDPPALTVGTPCVS